MGFADTLGSVDRPPIKGPPCGLLTVLDQMGDADAKALQSALDDPKIGSTAIARALRAEGFRVGRGTVARHRAGDCTCELRRGLR